MKPVIQLASEAEVCIVVLRFKELQLKDNGKRGKGPRVWNWESCFSS
jgi:hypothetical protein